MLQGKVMYYTYHMDIYRSAPRTSPTDSCTSTHPPRPRNCPRSNKETKHMLPSDKICVLQDVLPLLRSVELLMYFLVLTLYFH
jgi:hypothetical protein